jgi:hypothetical protein
MQSESQFGRTLSLDEAKLQVSSQLERDQMAMEQGLRAAGLDIDRQRLMQAETQFMQGLDLDRQRLAQQEQQFTQSLGLDRERMTQQGQQFTLEQALRERLGLGGLDVQRQQATADTALAQNQFLLQLAQALGGLSPEQMKKLFPGGTTAVPRPADAPAPAPIPYPGLPTPTPTAPPPPPGYTPGTPTEPIPLPGTPTTPPPTGTPRWDGEKYVYA